MSQQVKEGYVNPFSDGKSLDPRDCLDRFSYRVAKNTGWGDKCPLAGRARLCPWERKNILLIQASSDFDSEEVRAERFHDRGLWQ